MSKRTYEELRDMLRHELDVLTKKGEITKETLDYFHKLTSTLYKIEELLKSDEGSETSGYSQRGYSRNSNGYSDMMRPYMPMNAYGGSYDGGNSNTYTVHGTGSYDGGNSNNGNSNRGSYAMNSNDGGTSNRGGSYDGQSNDNSGRYSEDSSYRRGRYSREGYSRHSARDKMIAKLEVMADEAKSERDRMAIMECVEELEGR